MGLIMCTDFTDEALMAKLEPCSNDVRLMVNVCMSFIGHAQRADLLLANRYNNAQLESLRGEIYPLCKDQHGCRYLQKKLEERNPEHMQMIFLEINEHVVELMTGKLPATATLTLVSQSD